ncbi:MAG TPA: delta-60 repeat domain-containing protein, partial [Tepidisphaeraceae bacterium]|nr:delta-60 repeat domain-containing protein [Tepidisphaeraceae bacterium]
MSLRHASGPTRPVTATSEFLETRRLFAAGQFDPTFGDNGAATLPTPFPFRTVQLFGASVLQPDGKLIMTGLIGNGGGSDRVLARLNRDGTLDATFGDRGFSVTDRAQHDGVAGLALQRDGKIIA